MFVTLMQLVEYLIWSDLDCTNGNNKLAGIIGPILNYLQPFVIFIVLGIFKYKLVNLANILYLIYFIYYFYIYYKYSSKCSRKNELGHLSWVWSSHNKSNNNYKIILLYFIVTIVNFALVINNKSYLISFIITAICLFISNIFYSTNIGELWCLFVIIIPIILIILQRLVLNK